MTNELITVKVTFYRKGRVELAAVEVRCFALGLAFAAAMNRLEKNLPQSHKLVVAEMAGFLAELA